MECVDKLHSGLVVKRVSLDMFTLSLYGMLAVLTLRDGVTPLWGSWAPVASYHYLGHQREFVQAHSQATSRNKCLCIGPFQERIKNFPRPGVAFPGHIQEQGYLYVFWS